jgi:hypothetical protein
LRIADETGKPGRDSPSSSFTGILGFVASPRRLLRSFHFLAMTIKMVSRQTSGSEALL